MKIQRESREVPRNPARSVRSRRPVNGPRSAPPAPARPPRPVAGGSEKGRNVPLCPGSIGLGSLALPGATGLPSPWRGEGRGWGWGRPGPAAPRWLAGASDSPIPPPSDPAPQGHLPPSRGKEKAVGSPPHPAPGEPSRQRREPAFDLMQASLPDGPGQSRARRVAKRWPGGPPLSDLDRPAILSARDEGDGGGLEVRERGFIHGHFLDHANRHAQPAIL